MKPLARIIAAVAAVLIPLCSCVPPSSLPAPVPMGRDEAEVGVGAQLDTETANGSIYGHVSLGRETKWVLGGSLSGGPDMLLSTGVYARVWVYQSERWNIGFSGQAGFLYIGLGVPVSVRLTPRLWLYTHPQAKAAVAYNARLPLGVALKWHQWRLDLEGGVHSVDSEIIYIFGDELVPYAAAGISRRF